MHDFGPYAYGGDDGSSSRFYDQMRRRRSWSVNSRQGLSGYAAYLMGADPGVEMGALVGAGGAAAYDSAQGANAMNAILVGVTTGALTFLINRWLSKVLS
jgi:hypothetical protein